MLNKTKKKKLCLKCQECCKVIGIPTDAAQLRKMKFHQQKDFYEARGCRLVRLKTGLFIAIPSICPQLSQKGCKIQDTKPAACEIADERSNSIVEDLCLWKKSNQGRLKK